MNSLGDFFIKLGLLPDKNSFETGNRFIDGVSNGLNKLIATARNASVAMATTAVITGKMETADLKLASAIGMKTEQLDSWRTALKISGSDANAFVSTISNLDTKFTKLKIDGTFDQNLARSLGLLGLSYGDIADMDADTRTKEIIKAAQAMDDQKKASILIGDILGQAGRDFYEYMKLSGISLDEILNKSSASIFTDENTKKDAMEFNSQVQLLQATLAQISKLFGSEIGQGLTPVLKDINSWLQENRGMIKQLGDDLGTIAAWAGDRLGTAVKGAGTAATTAAAAGAAAIEGDYGAAAEGAVTAMVEAAAAVISVITGQDEVQKFHDEMDVRQQITDYANIEREKIRQQAANEKNLVKKGKLQLAATFYKPKYSELPDDIKEGIDATGGLHHYRDAGYIQDGIISPGGNLTHVAPDDWVFAARNVGDLAAAFIPQTAGAASAGPVEITINQDFTINGSNDIPQVLKQQAYNGTHDGLMEILSRAGSRMQLMPGLR